MWVCRGAGRVAVRAVRVDGRCLRIGEIDARQGARRASCGSVCGTGRDFPSPGMDPLPEEEFRRQVAAIASTEGWVIDGNYSAVQSLVWDARTRLYGWIRRGAQ